MLDPEGIAIWIPQELFQQLIPQLKIAERNNASFSDLILEKIPIFLYVKDYQNAVQKRSIISFRGLYVLQLWK